MRRPSEVVAHTNVRLNAVACSRWPDSVTNSRSSGPSFLDESGFTSLLNQEGNRHTPSLLQRNEPLEIDVPQFTHCVNPRQEHVLRD